MFENRVEAGRQLAVELESLRGQDAVVLGLPRGGVPVADEVAKALGLTLDVIVVRKLGVPFQPEVAMGAIGEGGVRVLDSDLIARIRITEADLSAVEERERATLEARIARLRRGRPRVDLHGRTAVIVDDGVATGSTARAACRVARHLGAARVVLAVPVGPRDGLSDFRDADEVVAVFAPAQFSAVGYHYRDFAPTTEDEVIVRLDAAARRSQQSGAAAELPDCDIDVTIPAGSVALEGHLHLPDPVSGVVMFAHGSGSSRHSPRNRFVADVLYDAGLGTLLLDLLTPEEELQRSNVFDIELLARRLAAATTWLRQRSETAASRIGYFGASTGAGAALLAAADPEMSISAVVSRGGRPDLAGPGLEAVTAPTLLIVGGNDPVVLDLNRQALATLRCPKELTVVAGATHLFEEPGTLSEVALLARDWFSRYLASPATDDIDDPEGERR
ncbi:MAG: phosphoribosyltransferase family protein [Aeromicrobium sp.]